MHWTKRTIPVLLAAAATIAAAQAPPPPPIAPSRFVVVLDAAHGGDDAGAELSNSLTEKNLTLAISVRLRSLLGARGIQVVTTRESDATVDPVHRAEVANHANAQACLSLHASESGAGIHLFTSSLAPAQTARIAAWKTTQAAWVTRSLSLAGVLNAALLHAGMTVSLGRTALPGIDSMACPAVAVEIAPERDADRKVTSELNNGGYQTRVADALAAAILEWRSEARP